MNDRALLDALLGVTGLNEREADAFSSMRDWLDAGPNRKLSPKQIEWAMSTAKARGLITDETENLWSTGRVPRGIPTKKTRGEERAVSVLSNRPLRPPGRSA